MGGVSFPCVAVRTTSVASFALRLLCSLLTRFTFMLEVVFLHLGLLDKPTDDQDAHHQYPTDNYVPLMDSSPSSYDFPADIVDPETSTLIIMIKNSLPVVEYGNFIKRNRRHAEDDGEDATCAVCLNYIEKSDEIRELSNCSHLFHRECLDTWLNNDQVTCPLCRSTL